METQIVIDRDTYEKYNTKIGELKKKIKDLSKPLTDFEKYYKGLIVKNYYSNGSIFGQWKPLSIYYLAEKSKWVANGEVMPNGLRATRLETLRLTDNLRKNVFDNKSVKVTKNKIEYKINVDYASLHQYGGNTLFGNVPARPFLFTNDTKEGIRDNDKVVLLKIIEKYLRFEENEENT